MIDWAKVPVDTPILVKKELEDKWEKRYFAKYDIASGRVYTFRGGTTSWSKTDDRLAKWNYAILAETELYGEDVEYNN